MIWVGVLCAHAANSAPAGRIGHTAIWTGTDMIIWGGYFYNGNIYYFNDGWRYNPTANTWTQISTNGAPSARDYHTAVWTGTEMIIWGGNHGGILNTGARYNPLTDTWTPMSTAGAPSSLANRAAVWTGTEMIIWGGGINGTSTTGARYNPTTDTWTAMSNTGAPANRSDFSALWTGTEFIVWGGIAANTVNHLNDGACYNPGSNTWTAVTTTGAPAARADHTAVWTGSEMIIWGGDMEEPPYDYSDGGRYNPASDSWIATITTDAPTPRAYHTAVWTGTNMIVWGGSYAYSGDLNDGSRYNTNGGTYTSWNPTTTTGAPSARTGHTAVWTGTEMIVWGGGSYLNDGGRYNPVSDIWASVGFGSLQVTINPAGAVSAGAQWQVDGTGWQNSGIVSSNLTVGTHTIAFSQLAGWITPSNQTLTIGVNQTNTTTATYIPLPVFQTVTLGSQTFTLTWSTVPGTNYQLQYITDLSSTNWINVGSPFNAKSNTITAIDSPGTDLQRFYRVVLEP